MIASFDNKIFSISLTGPCSNTEFKCTEIDVCMSEDKWCDSTKDCPKGSDEPDDCLVCKYLSCLR